MDRTCPRAPHSRTPHGSAPQAPHATPPVDDAPFAPTPIRLYEERNLPLKINRTPRIARLALGLGVTAVLGLGSTLSAFAAADTGAVITGGTLAGGGLGFASFGAITLNGAQQTSTAAFTLANVTDARGTGAGWNVSLNLTPLAEYNTGTSAYVPSGKTLAASSIKVTTAPIVSLVDSTSSPATTVTPVATTTALDSGSAVKLLSAAVNGGMGSYSFSNLTATLTVPANAYAKTYKSDATVSLNVAP